MSGNAFHNAPGITEELLLSKLSLPRLYASLVERPRLLALLDAGLERKLTLISAPAGFGKTTLLRQWIAGYTSRHGLPSVAWVSLDVGDNDPVRFWRYVITACQAFLSAAGQTAPDLLFPLAYTPFDRSPLEIVLRSFLNALSQMTVAHGILVLEEYHLINSPQIDELLAFMLEHLPAALHVVIITRHDPAFPLARLRASGDLSELHAPDLRFSQDEAMSFLQQTVNHLPVSEKTLYHLATRLEGWPAAFRIVALGLQRCVDQEQIEHYLISLQGGQRPLRDYFVAEVLAAQSEDVQHFLLCTCLLTCLSGELCDALLDREGSAPVLEMLERSNLFLEYLESEELRRYQWYRYHALFAEAIQHEARRRLGTEALRALAQRASKWYEQQGLLSEAVEMALKADDMQSVASLLERLLTARFFDITYEFHTLCRWLEQIPAEVIEGRPLLCLGYARALANSSGPDQPAPETLQHIDELLQSAERGWQAVENTSRLGEVFSFRCLLEFHRGERMQALILARQALEWLPAEQVMWRSICLQFLAVGEVLEGCFNAARKTGEEARGLWEIANHLHAKRSNTLLLALISAGQGELQLAAAYYRQALAQAREVGDRSDIASAQPGLAQLFYEWNELDTAMQAAQEAHALATHLHEEELQVQAMILIIRILFAQGQRDQAQQRLTALFAAHQAQRPGILLCQTRLQLANSDLSAARNSLDLLEGYHENLWSLFYEQKSLLVARLLLAQGLVDGALERLAHLLEDAREAGRWRSALEIRLLLALAHGARHTGEHMQKARQHLQEALAFAHTQNFQRIFLDEGKALVELLQPLVTYPLEKPLLEYVHSLLRAFAEQPPEVSVSLSYPSGGAPLSLQEQRVLRLLIAERSYPEIARELTVSLNTIKTQVNSIYRKLNVHNRREVRAVVKDKKIV